MGLLDKMFGGGTNLELHLDMEKIPEGGTLSGTATLSGGKKPLTLTALKVRLVYVKVEAQEDSPLPKIELQTLLDNTVISNQEIAPGSLNKYEFSFQVPTGTDPSGTYKVMAFADIPKVKDPKAEAELKVISADSAEASAGFFNKLTGKPSEDQILAKFPGLMSADDKELQDALHDLLIASYDRDNNFVNIANFLGKKMNEGSNRVRANALSAWGNILNDRAQPEHIQALTNMAADPAVLEDKRLRHEVISVAAKFAEEGAGQLVQWFVQHPNPDVRRDIASSLRFDADDAFTEKRAILSAMVVDPDAGVRAAAVGGLTEWIKEPALAQDLAQRSFNDPSPDVQAACLSAIALAHNYGMTDMVVQTMQQHLQNQHVKVRKEMADLIHWLPTDPRTTQLVATLLQDPSPEVRRAMAWQSCNMSEHPEMRDLFLNATNDPDEEVKRDAIKGMSRMLGMAEATAFYRQRLAQEPTETVYEAVYWGIVNDMDEAGATELMQELTAAPFADVARRARDAVANA